MSVGRIGSLAMRQTKKEIANVEYKGTVFLNERSHKYMALCPYILWGSDLYLGLIRFNLLGLSVGKKIGNFSK